VHAPPRAPRSLLTALTAAGRVLLRGLTELVYPNTCHVCTAQLPPEGGAFCPSCRAALLADQRWTCPRCASTTGPFANVEDGCTRCRDERFAFDGAVRLGEYDGLLRDVVLRLKHQSGECLAEEVGALWADHAGAALRSLNVDVVIPVPLHWWRRFRRGYNQTESLARSFAAALRVPCRPRWLRRCRPTKTQHYLNSHTDRRENVRNAFAARQREQVRGKRILLVEDVMRTCSTAHEAARPLRAAGAAQITVAVLARA
jgi:ComF family protein